MSGLCDTCKIKSRCISPEGGLLACPLLYEQDRKSRWFELFGTPESAARTMAGICESCKFGDCCTCGVPEWADYSHDYDALLEWLRGESDGK